MLSSENGSNESIYTSAPSSDHEDDNDIIKRPNYLTGSSQSSLIGENYSYSLSTLHSWTEKISANFLLHLWHRRRTSKVTLEEVTSEIPNVLVRILGYETIEREKKFTVYKIKVERRNGYWGVELIPNWFIYRRYNDFCKLHKELRAHFPDSIPELPSKKWVGSNFDPIFIGKRIFGLSKYLEALMKNPVIQNCEATRKFLCLDKPPNRASSASSNRALYDCFEETVKELRIQLRRKEALEDINDHLKEALSQRDVENDAFRSENEHLRKQKDALIRAFGHEDPGGAIFPLMSSSSNLSDSQSNQA